MKRHICIIISVICGVFAMATNTLTLSSVSGTPLTEVEVAVNLDNSDAIVALEMILPLGEHLKYVEHSVQLATARSNGHQVSAAQVGQDLRIYVYSLTPNALRGNTGELLKFRLLLGNEPDNYNLSPLVVLSNAAGSSLERSVQVGNVTIQAPKLQIVNTQIDYGHIPIRAKYTKNLQLKNVGNLPLTIENIITTDPLFVPKQTALTIEAQQTVSVTIEYAPVERGAVNTEVVVASNAINGEQVATLVADPFSVNELHVGTASGIADSMVTVSIKMNNMEPIVAMQCAFKLPKQLEYVPNSMVVNPTRSNGHQPLSVLHGDTLVLMLYSMTNQALHANDGDIATFQLRLNGSSGTYYLKPINVVLSNVTEENMVSATSQGKVTIKAPAISSDASINMGIIPINEEAYTTYSVRNSGSSPLVLERASFLAEGFRIVEELPITIATYKTTTITVAYQPVEEGDFSTTMNLYTSDPNNRLKTVTLSGQVFEPNELTLDGKNQTDGSYMLSVGLKNYTDIVAVQYDVHWRSDMTTAQAAFTPSERMSSHSYSVTPLGEDSYRVLIYSMSNAVIDGNEGELNQLIFSPQEDKSTHQLISKKQMANSQIGVLDCENARIPIDYVVDASKDIKVVFKMTVEQCNNETGLGNTGAWAGGMSSWFNADRKTFNILCGDVVDDYAFDYTYGDAIEVTMTNGYYEFKNSQGGYKKIEFESQNLYCSNSLVFCDNPCAWKGSVYYVKIYEDGQLVRNYLPQSDGTLKDIISGTIANPELGTTTYREELSDGNPSGDGEQGGNQGGNPIDKEQCYSTITIDNIVLSNANGTDKSSAKNVSLVAEQMKWGEETVTACDEYVWNGTTYTETGVYIDTIPSQAGCDSIVTLHLTVNHSVTIEDSVTICDSYTWTDGKTYTESGTYYQYLQTIHGCDSTVVLNLTVNRSLEVPYEVTTCDSYTWNNGVTYTQSGVYYDSLKTIHGCDSVEILTLTINYSDTAYFSATACDSYVWHDDTYTTSGTYEYLTQTVNGCDSLEVLTLTINRSVTSEETYVSCDSYTWNGETYSESGEYVYTTVAANGCDSIVTLHLTILPDATTESETLALCPSELPYEWYGQSLTEEGIYSAIEPYAGMECDSVIHQLNLQIYVQTLPLAVTPPVVYAGKKIDVSVPTEEIQAFINAETLYAPQSTITWYVKNNTEWQLLTDEIINFESSQIELKYVVETDCGNQESTSMSITILTTNLEESMSQESVVKKVIYDNNIYIIRNGVVYTIMGQKVD
ncbi:MAG: DUF1573 domain-containing protein [Paludibacteraceae bacterium]|nr:DUF1573 domain-containing protein [Paludibacteraceae bacterium]